MNVVSHKSEYVVGSTEWGVDKMTQLDRTDTRIAQPMSDAWFKTHIAMSKYYHDTKKIIENSNLSILINNIMDFVNFNKWAQIEGGENDKKWINDKYPDKFFNTGRVYENATDETYYYPMCDINDDPEGIAFHYEIDGGGVSYKIRPNMFATYGSAKQQKKWARKTKAIAKWKVYKEQVRVMGENNMRAELLVKHGPELAIEIEKSLIRENELEKSLILEDEINKNAEKAKTNRPSVPIINGTGEGIKLQITEKVQSTNDTIVNINNSSEPTPNEAY
jgi:hypothetical protein